MLPPEHPDRIHVAFDDHRLVANAGLLLPVTLAGRLGFGELVDRHVDLGRAPSRANAGDKMLTLVASAQAYPKDTFSKSTSNCPYGRKQASGRNPPDAGIQLRRARRNPPTHQNQPPLVNARNARNKVCAAAAKQQYRGKLVVPSAP